jgi:hypothetical protein
VVVFVDRRRPPFDGRAEFARHVVPGKACALIQPDV